MKGKRYKTCPRHKFWREESTEAVIRLKYLGSGINHMEVMLNGKRSGGFPIGINVGADWVKISEDECNKAFEEV